MKLKFKLITVFAALGVASSGFAAWNFATDTSNEVNIQVGIEAATGSIGSIDFDDIGIYNLADTPNPLVFNATFTPGSGIDLSKVDLTYKVTLNSALADLISFGALSEGHWVSDVPTSITPTWNAGKNPSDLAAYNAIKNNLANLSMNVSLSAKMKDGTELVPPDTVVPGALPDGLVEGPGGLIEYNKDLGPLQFVVHGLNAGGETAGVDQSFMWESSDPSRASVENGLVTPLADGNVTISATPSSFAGKGLKKAENEKPQALFHLNITGFTVIPPEPVATKIELVLGAGVVNEMVLEIGDEINVSARVLDENNNVMSDLVIEHELYDTDSATYVAGVIKAIAAAEENYIEFTYEELSVTFYFSVAALPVVEPAFILINGGVALEIPFAQGSGTLVAEVYDADYNVLEGEAVTWSVPNNNVISIVAETGAYTIHNAGQVLVTAKSVTNQYLFATLQLTVLEPPVVYHTVTFNYDNGLPNGSQQVAHNDSLVKPANPTREGYTFVDWTLDGESYDFGDAVLSDLILNAVWTKNTYTISFVIDGGSTIPNLTVAHGDIAVEPQAPTKEGYNFLGWFGSGSEDVYTWDTPVTSSFSLTAHWEVIQYTATFNTGEGGSAVPSQTINYGERFTEPGVPTREGYTFDGWLLGGIPFKFTDAVTGDVNLVAKWNPVGGGVEEPKTVILPLNNIGANVTTDTTSSVGQIVVDGFTLNYRGKKQSVSSNHGILIAFGNNGGFVGNKTPINGKIKSVEVKTMTGSSGSAKYFVKFGESEFTAADTSGNGVEIGADKSSIFTNSTVPDANFFVISASTKNGQVQNIKITYETGGGGTVTPVNKYNVHFNSNGGSTVVSQLVEEGQTVTKPDDPTHEGKEFVKWLHNGVEYDFSTPVTSELMLTAEWKDAGGPSVGGTVLLKHSESDTGNLAAGVNNAATVGLDPNVFDVRAIKGGSNQNVGVNKDGTLRLYYHINGGSRLEVSITNGQKISNLVFSFAGTVGQSEILVDGEEKYNSTPSSNSSVTINNIAASNFSIENVNPTSTQIWLNSIEITYGEAGPVAEFGALDSIEVNSLPNKLSFKAGEVFSSEGLKLLATDDSSPALTKIVSSGFTTNFDGVTFDESHVGEQTVAVNYVEGEITKQTSYTIQVKDVAALKTFAQITSEEGLHVGATYVIGGQKGGATWAMTTTQQGNNRTAEAATMSGENIKETATIQKFELVKGTKDGTYGFKVIGGDLDGQYIFAASGSNNYLRTEAKLTDNSSWTITYADGVMTMTAQGTNTRNTIRFNEGNTPPVFSCYASNATTGVVAALYLDTSYSG